MKKVLYVICAMLLTGVTAFQFTSCTNSEDENIPSRITELRFNINVNNASTHDTKVVKTSWEDGDKIYVFFKAGDTYLDAIKYVTLTYNGTTEEWDGALSGSLTDASELGSAGTMYGVYFPFGDVAIESDGASGVNFLSSGNTNPALNGQPIYTFYLSGSTTYTLETAADVATLSGNFDLTMPEDYVYFFIDKSGELYNSSEKYRLSVEGLKPAACTGFSAGTFNETELAARRQIWGYAYGTDGIAFSGKIDASWSLVNNHKFLLYSEDDPTVLSKTIAATLESHNTVNLKDPSNTENGWKKNGFRGYEVSPGILMRDEFGNYTLTDGSNPFELYDYSGEDASLNKYYFQWGSLKTEIGADGNNILANSDRLPSGWQFPTGGSDNSDWYKILRNKPSVAIQVEKPDNTIESITAADKCVAFVMITKDEKTYDGLLLLRDGTFIPKEGNLLYWGKGTSPNSITYEQYLILKDAGCLFLSITAYYSYKFSGWREKVTSDDKQGYYWSATCKSGTQGYNMNFNRYFGNLSVSPSQSSDDNKYIPVRLVKKL